MFFYLSKILWFAAAPSNLIFISIAAGVALLFTRRWRLGRALATVGALAGVALGSGPAGVAALAMLEERFPPVSDDAPAPAGIIVLGGAVGEMETVYGPQLVLNDAAERMTAALAYARRWPDARLVFTGGNAALIAPGDSEADAARRLWTSVGLDEKRAIYEDKSRNTYENAIFTRDLVQPKPGERWLLVTSAHHMPRSMGIFRKAGFDVTAAPVDWRTPVGARLPIAREWSSGLALFDLAAHEWLGLVAYRLSGKTDALLPGPR